MIEQIPSWNRLRWNWLWYLVMLTGAVLVGLSTPLPLRLYELGLFVLLTCLAMLRERLPEAVVLPTALAVWILTLLDWPLWQILLAGSLLCTLVFLSQLIWRVIEPVHGEIPAAAPATVLALGGQIVIVSLSLVVYGGPGASVGDLQAGSAALAILSLLLLAVAGLQEGHTLRRWLRYTAGLLLALALSWELRVLPVLTVDLFCLPVASYLVVLTPFLLRHREVAGSQSVGRVVAVLGACLLLGPSLLLSNIDHGSAGTLPARLISMLLLLGESLGLFLIGSLARVRFFVFGGAALVIVGAIEALIYAAAGGEQPGRQLIWWALALSGLTLVGGALLLTLRRSRHG
jgi:hypothetical protein